MNKELKFTDKTPTEPGYYYLLTDQYPVKVEIVDVGREYVVRYSSGQDVAMSNIPAEAQWHKRTKKEIEKNEGRAIVAVIFNTPCISCGACNQGMMKVGPFVICHSCFQKEFEGKVDSDGIYECFVKKNNPTYIEFVEKNKKEMSK